MYAGVTETQGANRSNASHLVTDTETWKAKCGKVVVDGYQIDEAHVATDVTCRTCLKAYGAGAASRER